MTIQDRPFVVVDLPGTYSLAPRSPDEMITVDVLLGRQRDVAAPEAVISLEAVRSAMRRRPARPLFLIDLALPRDVDPAVADLDNVFLYNLDDLAKIADENRAAREAEIAKCRAMLTTRAEALWQQIEPRLQASAPGSETLGRRQEPA